MRNDNVDDLRPGMSVLVRGHKGYRGRISGRVSEVSRKGKKVLVHLAKHGYTEWVARAKVSPWVKGNARRMA